MGSTAGGPPSTWQVRAHYEINWTIEEGCTEGQRLGEKGKVRMG